MGHSDETLAVMRPILIALLLVVAIASQAFAARGTAPSTIKADAAGNVMLDLPDGWIKSSDAATLAGFKGRTDSELIATFHPEGSRPTDMPYALLERLMGTSGGVFKNPYQAADVAAAYYTSAIDPPSKADRAGTWKSSTVSKPVWNGTFFSFRATIRYEGGINGNATYYVNVLGSYVDEQALLLSTWADDEARASHTAALNAFADNALHPPIAKTAPTVSFQERLTRMAKIAGVILILFVIGVQLFVLLRERKQRRAEELAMNELLPR